MSTKRERQCPDIRRAVDPNVNAMGVVLSFDPEDGAVSYEKPRHCLDRACGCDWGHCDRPGVAWRWSALYRQWLVVCARCIQAPVIGL